MTPASMSKSAPARGSEFVEIPLAAGVRLWVLPDKRFKNVSVRAWLHRPLDARATETALLPAVLRRGCRRQPTLARIAAFLENLYGASYGADVSKSGERHLLSFALDVVNDRFVPRGGKVLGEGARFLSRLLNQPVRQGKGLNRAYVEGEKENLRRLIEALVNDRGSYAYERCVRIMCEGEAFARYEYGRVEDLSAIDAASLAAFHREVLETAPAEFFVAGDVSPAAMEKLFRGAFPWKNRRPASIPFPAHNTAQATPRETIEKMDVEQGHLVIGARTGLTWADDGVFALIFANGVLGGFPHSKLFRNVREREGLAYAAGSSTDNAKGLQFISAGIDPANYERAVKVIREQIDALKQGDISDEEMDKTRASLVNRVRSREDSPSSKVGWFHELNTFGRRMTVVEAVARYEGLSREDVVAAARRVTLDTIYFLTRP
jgi:predicted Zn-dependent peptidase